jgi:gamma-glutamyltranspeptidase/glutathione hydrolase
MKIKNYIFYPIVFIYAAYPISAYTKAVAKSDTAVQAMVVAAHPLATAIGVEILKNGGNAVDAAVAIAFAIGVVEPHASGLGGGGGMLIYLHEKNAYHYIDFYMQTAQKADTAYSKENDLFTPRSICIPGTPAGLITAVNLFGQLPLATILAPAIRLAKSGFIVSDNLYSQILDKLEVITLYPQTQALFFKDDFPVAPGDTLVLPSLAEVLEKISIRGSEYFYRGEFARKAAKFIQQSGGYITYEDFTAYTPILREPVTIKYKEFDIYSSPPPQSGTTLLEILNIFEHTPICTSIAPIDQVTMIENLSEAIFLADSDRFYFLGDPNHFDVPVDALLDEKYAQHRFLEKPGRKKTFEEKRKVSAGNPWIYVSDSSTTGPNVIHEEDGQHTTHISVVDPEGNAVSLTQTIGFFFGSGFSCQGVLFNSAMSVFYKYPAPNRIGPRRRPLTTICPTIITQDDRLFAILGTPGGGTIFNVLAQVIIRLLDYKRTPQQAVAAPRFSTRINSQYFRMENDFPRATIDTLKNRGYPIQLYERHSSYFGAVHLIVYDTKLNQFIGVSDPRRDGAAMGF